MSQQETKEIEKEMKRFKLPINFMELNEKLLLDSAPSVETIKRLNQ